MRSVRNQKKNGMYNLGQAVVLAMPPATLWPLQGKVLHLHAMGDTTLACFGRIPTNDHQGAQRRRATTSEDFDDDSDSDGSNIDDKDGEYGINDDGEVYSDGGNNDDNDDSDDDVDVDFVHDNDNDGTMSMR